MGFLTKIAMPGFTNHSALPDTSSGLDGMIYFFSEILHRAFSKLKVTVLDMVADEHNVQQ